MRIIKKKSDLGSIKLSLRRSKATAAISIIVIKIKSGRFPRSFHSLGMTAYFFALFEISCYICGAVRWIADIEHGKCKHILVEESGKFQCEKNKQASFTLYPIGYKRGTVTYLYSQGIPEPLY